MEYKNVCFKSWCLSRYILNDSEFFFDRSPRHFESILNLYRTGQLHLMEGVCVEAFSEELAYWGLGNNNLERNCTDSPWLSVSRLTIAIVIQ